MSYQSSGRIIGFPADSLSRGRDQTSPSKCVILIVDDSEVDLATYRRYLTTGDCLGYHLVDAETAEAALRVCQQVRPDVILVDYSLPDATGIELLEDLRKKFNPMPAVVMLTGQGCERIAVDSMKQGAYDYLTKGDLTSGKLINIVSNAITAQRLKVRLEHQRQQRQLLAKVALQIRDTVNISQILQATVEGGRELLECDRVLIYRFNDDLSGTVVAESVAPQWPKALDDRIEDNCFHDEDDPHLEKFLMGKRTIVADVTAADLTPCHRNMLQQYKVKAVCNLPIIIRDEPKNELGLWGLLIAHHCDTEHEWIQDELSLLDELVTQVGLGIQQAELIFDLKTSLDQERATANELNNRMRELEDTTQLLANRNQELNEFSYVASHDLKAPLRGIANLSEWLSEDLAGKIPAENQEQLHLIHSRVLQLNGLIDRLLHYAQAGREQVERIAIPLSQLIVEITNLLMPPPAFQVQFSQDLPIIETQTLLLKQVLTNLIGNAIKYHDRENGKVEILVKEQPSLWEFTVVDDGPGIAVENHAKIFSIFQTLPENNQQKGTGVGLTIVKKLVEQQGGTISIKSKLGQGSTFSFTWPK